MADWKGILLAGGTGSRLAPLTLASNKHLLPIWDKPMIYYPLSTLMLEGIREIAVVSTREAIPQLRRLLHDGSQWGMALEFIEQEKPNGIAECFLLAEEFIRDSNTALILGDNIFYGSRFSSRMAEAMQHQKGATIFGYDVSDPTAFGVVTLDQNRRPVTLEEKPSESDGRLAVPGLYFYDQDVVSIARQLEPSPRGELEITGVNEAYLARGDLRVLELGRGVAWLDGGTPEDMFEASQFIKVLEERTGLKIGCPEEIAYRSGFITDGDFINLARDHPDSRYGDYLQDLIESERLWSEQPSDRNAE
jgi:glucose-1-phosphate thymidylyltransferase